MPRARDAAIAMLLGAGLLFCRPAVPDRVPEAHPVAPPEAAGTPVDVAPPPDPFVAIDALVEKGIAEGRMPGCVVAMGRADGVLFERAYGARAVLPQRTPMTTDTVFDLASLTKAVATSMSLMILVDRGLVDLDAPAARYVPALARLPPFTVRHLLLHTSGLPAVTRMADWSTDRDDVLRRIGALSLKTRPGEGFVYSDVGFVVLQEIVERTSRRSLAAFASEEIFRPLGMTETGFLPPPELRARAAPTELRGGAYMQGEVHDPRAFALGGVSGNAGVFSTARDLAIFARAMLRGGGGLVSRATLERFLARHDTTKGGRALGWDLDSAFATHRSALFSPRAFGHGGYTGTALWIDPERDAFVLFLSNRVHPDGKGAVNPLVAEIGSVALDVIRVRTGIDVLREHGFAELRGARVGLVTNAAARAASTETTADVLRANVDLRAVFTPEHGMNADREGSVADATWQGLPLYSLYGGRSSPTAEMYAGLDAIVFDLQDAGVRFYTYASTMKRAMKVAAEHHLRFVVLDRPNPLGGTVVEGPVLPEAKGFLEVHPMPLRHGMTMGELARLFAADDAIDVKLEVIPLERWRRSDTFERTGLAWTPPSPNLKSVRAAALYPAIGLLESTNVSVGRGTDMPFEIVAAPWLEGATLARRLGAVPGVAIEPVEVTPTTAVYAHKRCRGIRVRVTDASFEPIRTALAIAGALRELHPEWNVDGMDRMLRWPAAMAALKAGQTPAEIEATWAAELAAFRLRREPFLLYRQ